MRSSRDAAMVMEMAELVAEIDLLWRYIDWTKGIEMEREPME